MMARTKKKAVPFDPAEFLQDAESQRELIEEAFASGDPAYIADALGLVARARGMSAVAEEVGVTREALYKSLRKGGDPRLSTLVGTVRALGFNITVEPIE